MIIDEQNSYRIVEDCKIVFDCMGAIMNSKHNLDTCYLEEKVEKAQRCIDFMKSFYKGERND